MRWRRSLRSGEPLWSIPDAVNDVAISSDGGLVAIATSAELKMYDAGGNLLWSYSAPSEYEFTAVDVSDDRNAVVACIYDSGDSISKIMFWKNAKSLSGSPEPSWTYATYYNIGLKASQYLVVETTLLQPR